MGRIADKIRQVQAFSDILRWLFTHRDEIAELLALLVQIGVLFGEEEEGRNGVAGVSEPSPGVDPAGNTA